jgi:tRNA (guanine-N7-)-methyltransferase
MARGLDEILHVGRLPWPAPWADLFGREAPLLLEIGFGGGDFLVDLARKRPSHNVLGFEISLPALRKAVKKLATAGLTNARVIQADSRVALWTLCAPGDLHAVTINFPDPWPKSNHHHRRLINDEFLHLLATRMQIGGLLEIATDHAAYAAVIADCLARSPTFSSRLPTAYVTTDPTRLVTKYEQIARDAGRACHYFKQRRTPAPAPDLFPIPVEVPMPHVVLHTPLTLAEIGRRFAPHQVTAGDVHLKYIELYHAARGGALMVEAYVSEEPYHQHVGLSIRRRARGDTVLSVHEVGFPRPTRGLHLAVYHLLDWLRDLDPGLHLVSSTLNVAENEVLYGAS